MDPEQLFKDMVELADEILAAPTTDQDVSDKMVEMGNKLDYMAEWDRRGGFTKPEWRTIIEEKLEQIQLKVSADRMRSGMGVSA